MASIFDAVFYKDGNLYWRPEYAKYRQKGPIGTLHATNYRIVMFDRKYYMAHRVIWELFNGPIDSGCEIDHIDHNPKNNKIDNLRVVTRAVQNKNKRRAKNNSTGVTGVYYCKQSKRWYAQIGIDSKTICLGYFGKKEDAALSRKHAEIQYGFHKNHGGE